MDVIPLERKPIEAKTSTSVINAEVPVQGARAQRRLVLACCCYQPYFRGGGEVANQRLAAALQQAGYDLTVISIGDRDCRENIDGIDVIRLKSANVHWLYRSTEALKPVKALWHVIDAVNWMMAKRIGVLLDELQPDCLITSTIEDISTFTWREAKRRGIRTIDMLHSYYLLCYSGSMFRNGKNCNGQCVGCSLLCYPKKINSDYVDDVIGVTRYVLNKHLEQGLFANARTHVIPNIGFDEPLPSPTQPVASAVRDSDKQGPEKLRIGYLGRLHRSKGIEQIIDAIALVADSTRFEVLIAGAGDDEYRQQLQDAAERQHVAVTFLGHVPPEQLFTRIDYLVVPSQWQEPFGLVLTEAARAGIPVLAARAGGIPEVIGTDLGLCFSGVIELAALLRKLLVERPHFEFASLQRFEKATVIESWRALLDTIPARVVNG